MTDRIILASASERRRVLLAQVRPEFDVIPSPLLEPADPPTGVGARAWAIALAYYKARSVAGRHPRRWVLGADTIVLCCDEMLGKPAGASDAARMLRLQSAHESEVITGVCFVYVDEFTVRRVFRLASTRVWIRNDEKAIAEYVETGDWAGKAGAYGIQDVGDRLVERFEGSFSNVVGLPLETLRGALREVGLDSLRAP